MTPAPPPVPASEVKAAPAAKPAAVKPVEKSSKTYVVKKGDSLSEIAKAHNTTVKKIMAINPAIKTADNSSDGRAYYMIGQYLSEILLDIAKLPPSDGLQLQPGINACDISAYPLHLQGLVISSVMDWVAERARRISS